MFFLIVFTVVIYTVSFSADVSCNFFRETRENSKIEKVYGFMYFKISENDKNNSMYLHVTAPVNQIIEYKTNKTTIYYPDEKKAFIFKYEKKSAKINPMDPAFKKIDLSAAGFILAKKERKGKGKREIWVPKEKKKSPIKEIVLGTTGSGAVNFIEIKATDGRIISRMKYGNFMKVGSREIPLYFEAYKSTGSSENFETTKLSDPDSKSGLPEELQNFKI